MTAGTLVSVLASPPGSPPPACHLGVFVSVLKAVLEHPSSGLRRCVGGRAGVAITA